MQATDHIQLLKLAEQQFRLACTVHFAVSTGGLSLDVPLEQTFGHHRTDYKEFGLRQDQAGYAAAALEFVATFTMAQVMLEAIKQSFPGVKIKEHENAEIVAAYQISRMIRNAFAHHMLRPMWSIDDDCRDRKFAVGEVISLETSGLNGQYFDWRHYGGHLAVWRLSQWVRFTVLHDTPPANRVEPPYPKVEAHQQGRLILRKVADTPGNDP